MGLSLAKLGTNNYAEKMNPPVKPVDKMANTAKAIMNGKITM
jgi:hypothetical protein